MPIPLLPEKTAKEICGILKCGGVVDPQNFEPPMGWTPEKYKDGLEFALQHGWIEIETPNVLKLTNVGARAA